MIGGDTHSGRIYVSQPHPSAMPQYELGQIEMSRYESLEAAPEPAQDRPVLPVDGERAKEREREKEILRVVKAWHRDNERRVPGELKLILAVTAAGILMVIGGTLWGEIISGDLSDTTSASRLSQLVDDALTAARMVQYGFLTALVGMFVSLLIVMRASGFKF